jgi:hypothetical protein|tara:strand:- start:193 stop:558 length:366 start_codon:yes stop_codon:yes gene_type:complete
MCNYLRVDEELLKNNLIEIISQLKYIEKQDDKLYFYGGNDIDIVGDLECNENRNVINNHLPIIKKSVVGHSNWCNMSRSKKYVGNHLRFLFKILLGKDMEKKCVRHPVKKSYLCNKYFIQI